MLKLIFGFFLDVFGRKRNIFFFIENIIENRSFFLPQINEKNYVIKHDFFSLV